MAEKRTKCWKPGNLVTIEGIVYRVKREPMLFTACGHCAFGNGLRYVSDDKLHCSFPTEHYENYPLPSNCYLKRESPVKHKPLILKVNYYE